MQGEARNERGQTLAEFLQAYDPNKYERPSVTVDMVVFTISEESLDVVLIRRRDHPNIGKWALPGGFIDMGETLLQSAARELREETGLTGVALHPLGTFGEPSRDPRTRIVTAAFAAYAPLKSLHIAAGDDAADAKLFSVSVEKRGRIAIPGQDAAPNALAIPCTACGELYSGTGEEYAVTLKSGETALSARVALAQSVDGLGEVPVQLSVPDDSPGELAGDHALILFTALCQLAGRNALKTARLMDGDPFVLECALSALR